MKKQANNLITIKGNLGNLPEIKELTSGLLCAKFNVATRSFTKDENGKSIKNTQWHKVVAWGKTAEFAKLMLNKGLYANIQGKSMLRSYKDKDGNNRCYSEIVANKIFVIRKKDRLAIS